jgi:hypothetical protein
VRDALLGTLGSSSVNCVRGVVPVESEGEPNPASEWLAPNRRARQLDGARVRLPAMRDEWFGGLMSPLAAVLDEHQEMTLKLGNIGEDV